MFKQMMTKLMSWMSRSQQVKESENVTLFDFDEYCGAGYFYGYNEFFGF